jgi:hypothetical protein
MKAGIFAISAIVSVTLLISINSYMLHRSISGLIEDAEVLSSESDGALQKAIQIKQRFEDLEWYVSLTVNHEDLTNIEECYSDLVGYLSVNMNEEATVTKSRLIDALKHLRRLSGVNIDSII